MEPITEGMAFLEPAPEDALILRDIHFDFDKSDIRNDDRELLEEINEWMLNHPDAVLQIEGHCDERGTKEYNLALGERRALSIRSHLTALGTNPARMLTISYGEEKPLSPESTEEAWALNRRGHFLVDYGDQDLSPAKEEPLAPDEMEVEIEEIEVTEVEVLEPEPREEEREEETERPRSRERVIGRYRY